MEAWVAKKDSRLAAVRIFPLTTKGVPDRAQGEFIALSNYAVSKGVLVPRHGYLYFTTASRIAGASVVPVAMEGLEFSVKAALDAVQGLLGETPLVTASRSGNPQVVRMLLEKGADVNARGVQTRRTPLADPARPLHLYRP